MGDGTRSDLAVHSQIGGQLSTQFLIAKSSPAWSVSTIPTATGQMISTLELFFEHGVIEKQLSLFTIILLLLAYSFYNNYYSNLSSVQR